MTQLLYIVWNPDLVAFRLGPLSVRWYGLMWGIAIRECRISYAGHGVRDINTRQARAITECRISYAGHRVRDGHTRQARATTECPISYAGHGVLLAAVCHFFRDDNRAGVFVRI